MIARLSGLLVSKSNNTVVLDVSGVGYEVELPLTDACELINYETNVVLFTHFVVREDAQLLFGFLNEDRRDFFRLLIKVNGVGPKVALAILSTLDIDELLYCFREGDVGLLTKVPGIGKKTAERLVIDMRDRLAGWQQSADSPVKSSADVLPLALENTLAEAQAALVALGYKPAEAEKMTKNVETEGATVEEIIRQALRGMVKTK